MTVKMSKEFGALRSFLTLSRILYITIGNRKRIEAIDKENRILVEWNSDFEKIKYDLERNLNEKKLLSELIKHLGKVRRALYDKREARIRKGYRVDFDGNILKGGDA